MFDDLRSDDAHRIDDHHRERRSNRERPLADREVPLPIADTGRALSPALHAWLDGELPEAAARQSGAERDVQFWKLMAAATETRRHLRTPDHVQQRIMDALPHNAPQLITPWWRREFVLTPAAAVGVAGALVALTAAITALIIVLAHR